MTTTVDKWGGATGLGEGFVVTCSECPRTSQNPWLILGQTREYAQSSAIVTVDGVWQFTTGMKYGYGDHALYECAKILRAMGYLPEADPMIALSRECREAGIALYVARRDVLKRELPKAWSILDEAANA